MHGSCKGAERECYILQEAADAEPEQLQVPRRACARRCSCSRTRRGAGRNQQRWLLTVLYKELAEQHPSSSAIRRIPLDFKVRLDTYQV